MIERYRPHARADAPAARLPWQAPRLHRLAAGSAEIGANPQRPEGTFASGGS